MKTDVALLHYLTKRSHLDEDNINTKIWCCNNIDCNFEHVMHKSVDSYPQPLCGFDFAYLSLNKKMNLYKILG